jgi:hypothetical protein
MSNRGGKRRGAGRPLGSKNRRTAEIARAAAESGITPIEVMLGTMRELWAQGTPEAKRQAAEIAKDAAPYIHPRLASIDQTLKDDRPFAVLLESCSNAEEWEAIYGPKAIEAKSSGSTTERGTIAKEKGRRAARLTEQIRLGESSIGEGIPCCICTSPQSALWSWLM